MSKIILGGGLGGLSAGYYLLKKFPSEHITILESRNRTGGWIRSVVLEGVLFEQAARTIRPRGEAGINTLELIEELNLEKQLVPVPSTSPAALNRMVYAKGKLHSLPSSFKGLFQKQELFSKPIYKYLLNDIAAARKDVDDESLYDFVDRRFGTEVADYLISPLICGICAGNAKEISVNFLMETLFDYEQKYGNIYKGFLNNILKPKQKKKSDSLLYKKATQDKWSVYSFKNGLETLTSRLNEVITDQNGHINLGSHCRNIQFNDGKVLITLKDGKTLSADHLVSSIPAKALAALLAEQHPDLSKMLQRIETVTVAVVNLHFEKDVIQNPGFGFLVAPKEKLPILGVIYDSCCFPTKDNNSVLTVMMGGYWFERYFGNNPMEQKLLLTGLKQLNRTMGIKDQPLQYRVSVLKNCIPQYRIGHKENLNNILNYITKKKLPLSLCGSSYFGVGVNDVILSAKNAVENL